MGKVSIDEHSQPPFQINYNRRLNRAMHELIGFLRGIVADNHVNPGETESLAKWRVAHSSPGLA